MYIPELSLDVMGSFMLTPRSLSERGLIRVERDICALVVHPPLEQAIIVGVSSERSCSLGIVMVGWKRRVELPLKERMKIICANTGPTSLPAR